MFYTFKVSEIHMGKILCKKPYILFLSSLNILNIPIVSAQGIT